MRMTFWRRDAVFGMVASLALILPGPVLAEGPRSFSELWGDMLGIVDPWFSDLAGMLGDLTGWHAPEVLENGDILIRRRRAEDQPSVPPADPSSESEDSSGPVEL